MNRVTVFYRVILAAACVVLPAGLQLASKLPEPIFTPSTKSDVGHDENIDWKECCRLLGAVVVVGNCGD